MANDTSKVKLPHKVVTSIINKAKDTSTIAALSLSTPQTFSDTRGRGSCGGREEERFRGLHHADRRKAREGGHDHTRLRRAALGRRGQPA